MSSDRLHSSVPKTLGNLKLLNLVSLGARDFLRILRALRPDLRILDAGCGTGFTSFALLKTLQLTRFRARLAQQNITNV